MPAALTPAPEALAPWTVALRNSQPEESYAAVYRHGDKRLIFMAGNHATDTTSLTFRLIEGAYRSFDFDIVIAEGFPASWGVNPQRLIDFARSHKAVDGFQDGGETVPTVLGARDDGADVMGGEPDDADIRAFLVAEGISLEDMLGFYTLRSIPQWIRERKIEDARDPQIKDLIDKELRRNRERLGLTDEVLPDNAAWLQWYTEINAKPLGKDFTLEETGPLADGPWGSNRIGAAISRARDGFLHNLIIERLNRGESVLVVFGGSHYLIHRPALKAVLGSPCYVGGDLQEALAACGESPR